MKIIFLNVWNAKIREPLTDFIKEHLQDTDVFCFQEAEDDAQALFQDLLSGYQEIHAAKVAITGDHFRQSTHVKKNIPILSTNVLFEGDAENGIALDVEIPFKSASLHIRNAHGLSRPVDKLDNPQRLAQSAYFIETYKNNQFAIIGGDFNMFPENESIRLFEKSGYQDLIKDFAIKTTRNRIAWEKYPETPQYYSDYVFLKGDLRVKTFSVPENEISDHLPMILEIGA